MSANEEETARIASPHLTPCWWTLGLLLPAFAVVNVVGSLVTSENGALLFKHPVVIALNGAGILGFAFSFVCWLDEWAEFNRRTRAGIAKPLPSSPEQLEPHRNVIRIVAFGCGWLGVALVFGGILKLVGIAR